MKNKEKLNSILYYVKNNSSFNCLVMPKFLVVVISLGITQILYSQQPKPYHIPDSLTNYSYNELFAKQNEHYYDTVLNKIYALAYLHKAKNEQDTIKIANGYTQMTSSTNRNMGLIYSDSLIALTQHLNHFRYPGFGYIAKGLNHYNIGNYEKSLENYLIAHEFATKHQNTSQLIWINTGIADIKSLWGDDGEALEIRKSLFETLINQTEIIGEEFQGLYFSILTGLSQSYISNKKLDSAMLYTAKGLKESLIKKDSAWYYSFVAKSGEIAYYQDNFKMALDSINKAAPFNDNYLDYFSTHFHKGQIYWKQEQLENAFFQFKKADSIYDEIGDVMPEVREVQEFFVDYYKKENDTDNQLKYIDRLLYVDSIIRAYNKNLAQTLNKKYDTPLLLAEKENIIAAQNKQAKEDVMIIYGLALLIVLVVVFSGWSYKKQRLYKKRFDGLITKGPKTIKQGNSTTHKIPGISPEIIKDVLDALNSFEKNNDFLDNTISLNSLAVSANTNANYLSKIINGHKNKNFSSYLTDLRIDACIEKLKNDPQLRKYAIKAIASEVGFNNTESFSKAFFKRTKIYPSFFIKELERQI